ncbi:membrane-bound lytic murein transglycosylase MltF [Saccharospirillum impatiens]|uniref:membrane-bound lytic murein transglycosylase MltF n=1 Tax=Saccharospirillum impatiens TaxID=169438 RepID=UPI0004096002|nr:membrane-bound lytic murein transglycosylase MltF [Saccharospirillum impatiens]
MLLTRRSIFTLCRGTILVVVLAGLGLWVAAGFTWHNHWQRVQARNTLIIAIRETDGVYVQYDQTMAGLEYDLAQLLGQQLDIEVQLFAVNDLSDLYRALAAGAVDMALAGTSYNADQQAFTPGLPYLMTRVGLAREMASTAPELDQQRIATLDPISHGSLSARLTSENPALEMVLTSAGPAELMTRIDMGGLDMALLDERDFLVMRPFFPNQRFDPLTDHLRPVAPLFRNQRDRSLIDAVNGALRQLQQTELIPRLEDRYLGHTRDFDYVGNLTFERHISSRLPEFEAYFREQAEQTGLDWRLLAAVAYQESHWRRNAVSPTGVRGLMMVTLTTAREMGIDNRLDPQQSVQAGSQYLASLQRRVPRRIQEPDRTWMALASYNVGAGHLEDARIITETLGDDPDSWIDVRRHLPKLALQEWHPYTRFGYARGREPVVYVANIRRYYNVLLRVFPAQQFVPESLYTDRLDTLPMPGLTVTPGP